MESDQLEGYCSFCKAKTIQTCIKKGGFPVKRAKYSCGGCSKTVLPCRKKNCNNFSKAGFWDDEWCSVCDGSLEHWPLSKEEKDMKRNQLAQAAEDRARKANPPLKKIKPSLENAQPEKEDSLLNPGRWH